MKHCGLTFTRLLLLAASTSGLCGCVPISVDAYAGGETPESLPDGSTTSDDPRGQRSDASSPRDAQTAGDSSIDGDAGKASDAARTDAAVNESRDAASAPTDAGPPETTPVDASAVTVDAGDASRPSTSPADTGVGDAGQPDWRVQCAAPGVFCDDFEGSTHVACPTNSGLWSSCEMLGPAPEAKLLAQAAPHGSVLYSSTGQDPTGAGVERAGRVSYDLPANLTQFHGEFAFFLQPGQNALYTLWKLEQEVLRDENGEAQHYVGVSLVAKSGSLRLVVQTVNDQAVRESEVDVYVRALPQTWTRVRIDVAIQTRIEVTLAFDDEPSATFPPFMRGTAQVDHVAFVLGVYTDDPGSAAALYDNVLISAAAP